MNRTYACLLLLVYASISYSNPDQSEIARYSFSAELVDAKAGVINLTYTNTSKVAHCIRPFDFGGYLYHDAYLITKQNGKTAGYIGPQADVGDELIEPRTFIIVLPDESIFGQIELREFYKLPKGEITVSYSLPVALCSRVLEGYFPMPFPVNIKEWERSVKDSGNKKQVSYEVGYPEWWGNGFIADMTPLKFER